MLDELVAEGKAELDSKGTLFQGKWKKAWKREGCQKECRPLRTKERAGKPENMQTKTDMENGMKKGKNGVCATWKRNMRMLLPYEGTFIGHPKGFGFVEVEGEESDIFIPEDNTGTAMHQDKVRVIITREQKEGKTKRRNCDKDPGAGHAGNRGNLRDAAGILDSW